MHQWDNLTPGHSLIAKVYMCLLYTEAGVYSIEDYRDDIRAGYRLPPPQRGAAFAAAAKRLKQAIVLDWLTVMAQEQAVDLTPTLANHIIAGWMGRSVDRLVLLNWFATTGRTASDKSRDHYRCGELIKKYREKVQKELKNTQPTMETVREEERVARFEKRVEEQP